MFGIIPILCYRCGLSKSALYDVYKLESTGNDLKPVPAGIWVFE